MIPGYSRVFSDILGYSRIFSDILRYRVRADAATEVGRERMARISENFREGKFLMYPYLMYMFSNLKLLRLRPTFGKR